MSLRRILRSGTLFQQCSSVGTPIARDYSKRHRMKQEMYSEVDFDDMFEMGEMDGMFFDVSHMGNPFGIDMNIRKSKRRAERTKKKLNDKHDTAIIEKVVQLISRDERAKRVFGRIHPGLVHSATSEVEECDDHHCDHVNHSNSTIYSFQFVGSRRMRKGRCFFTCQVLHDSHNPIPNSAMLTISSIMVQHGSNEPWEVQTCVASVDANGKVTTMDVIDVEVRVK
jgi:hypothetical protein